MVLEIESWVATSSHLVNLFNLSTVPKSFIGVDAEMMQIRLNNDGIAVSLGSACNSKSIEPSHVLTAMNLPREQIESTLRISLGMPTKKDELDILLGAITHILPRVMIQ